VKVGRAHRSAIEHWTREERDAFLAWLPVDNQDRPWILFGLATGLRQGEMLGLRWADLDHADETATRVRVVEQLTRKGRGDVKSEASERTIPLNDLARVALRQARLNQAWAQRTTKGWKNPDGYLFVQAAGRHINYRTQSTHFSDLVAAATKKLGIPSLTIHGLRHTFATQLLTEGERIEIISKLLGHSDITITLKTYAKLDPERAQVAVDRISAAMPQWLKDELATQEGLAL
jgi:integrase